MCSSLQTWPKSLVRTAMSFSKPRNGTVLQAMHIIFGLPYSWIVLLLLIPAAGLKIPRGLRLRGSTFHLKNQVFFKKTLVHVVIIGIKMKKISHCDIFGPTLCIFRNDSWALACEENLSSLQEGWEVWMEFDRKNK